MWLNKSEERAEKNDPDFEPSNEIDILSPPSLRTKFDKSPTERTFLVYESKLRKLFQKWNVLNLKFIEESTFYKLRGDYVYPEINKEYKRQRKDLLDSLKDEVIDVSVGDQCDSPRHNATYCTVSSMKAKSNKIIDLIIHTNQVNNSNCML